MSLPTTAAPTRPPADSAGGVTVEADLQFSVSVDGEQMRGTVTGSGTRLELSVDHPTLLGGSGTEAARALAAQLAAVGLQLTVTSDRPLAVLGVPRNTLLQRRITGSPHIQVPSLGAAVRLVRLRRRAATATPLVPPATPMPLLPTVMRRPRVPTTTHDEEGGGYPRLVLVPGGPGTSKAQRRVWYLVSELTIGGMPGADLELSGLRAQHAVVRRNEHDEFVLEPVGTAPVRVNGGVLSGPGLLRTGSRIQLGEHTLAYAREEYADHGRPYGGRVGGELGRQRPQRRRGV